MFTGLIKKTCGICNKDGCTAICFGCQRAFCTEHFDEHRNELSQQLDQVSQEHNTLRYEFGTRDRIQPLFDQVDRWERESMRTIEETAVRIRTEIQRLHERTKNEWNTSANQIAEEIQSSNKNKDYTEIKIQHWLDRLRQLREMMNSTAAIKFEYETKMIPLLKLVESQSTAVTMDQNGARLPMELSIPSSGERFTQHYGRIQLSNKAMRVTALDFTLDGSCVTGCNRYTTGKHQIRFSIREKQSKFIFFGIITSDQPLNAHITQSPSTYGWWEFDFPILRGKTTDRPNTTTINPGDEIRFILDCDRAEIQLEHDQSRRKVKMNVDLQRCPFPWKILLRLDSKDDSVEILSSLTE